MFYFLGPINTFQMMDWLVIGCVLLEERYNVYSEMHAATLRPYSRVQKLTDEHSGVRVERRGFEHSANLQLHLTKRK